MAQQYHGAEEKSRLKTIDLVIKIGSMALIQREDGAIDYNIFQRLGDDLRPGMALVTSGPAEIGRLDYLHRAGHELTGDPEQVKTDYAAQGQIVLMDTYRKFVRSSACVNCWWSTCLMTPSSASISIGCCYAPPSKGAIPIINYNDPVSADEEIRKMELASRRK